MYKSVSEMDRGNRHISSICGAQPLFPFFFSDVSFGQWRRFHASPSKTDIFTFSFTNSKATYHRPLFANLGPFPLVAMGFWIFWPSGWVEILVIFFFFIPELIFFSASQWPRCIFCQETNLKIKFFIWTKSGSVYIWLINCIIFFYYLFQKFFRGHCTSNLVPWNVIPTF